MSVCETARKNYEMAHIELIWRLRLRDQVLMFYLTAIGTIFGISLGTKANLEMMLIIPFLALGAVLLVTQHNAVIASLLEFSSKEIKPFLKENNEYAPQFESSKTFKRNFVKFINLRTWAHVIIMLVPCIVALAFNWNHALNSTFPMGSLWWFACLFSIGVVKETISIHTSRIKGFDSMDWD